MWFTLLSLLTVVYIIKKIVTFRRLARSLGDLPGHRTLIGFGVVGSLFPKFPGISIGRNPFFDEKHSVFAWAGCDIVTHVSAFPSKADLVVADAAVAKEVTSSRSRFPKPIALYTPFLAFGPNLLASEGDVWKRYRKIASPAFSEKNNKLVWDEAVLLMRDLFSTGWENQKEISVDNCLDLTITLSLYLISTAGFGRRMTWKEYRSVPSGHPISLETCMHIVTTYVIPKILLPGWAMELTNKTREIETGFKELRSYMIEMIEDNRNSEVKRHDLLSNFLAANASETETASLSADEVISNIYIFLLAGHETTAHSLAFVFGLLALYQDEQEKLYQHIKSVVKDPQAPTYSEMSLLTRSLAVFYEALRMLPVGTFIPKISTEDTKFTTTNAKGETVVVPVPKGTEIYLHTVGLHYNPKYWKDPFSYNPDRFMQPDWNKDAFIPFSAGATSCVGRKFAEIESVVAITMLVSQYKITVKEEPRFAGETWEEKKERVLKYTRVTTIKPVRVPLTFTRRT